METEKKKERRTVTADATETRVDSLQQQLQALLCRLAHEGREAFGTCTQEDALRRCAQHQADREADDYLEEEVDIRLFQDHGRYREPLYVGINGKNCIIPRGEFVRVKRKFALLIEQSELQEWRAAEAWRQARERMITELAHPHLLEG